MRFTMLVTYNAAWTVGMRPYPQLSICVIFINLEFLVLCLQAQHIATITGVACGQ